MIDSLAFSGISDFDAVGFSLTVVDGVDVVGETVVVSTVEDILSVVN